jgi:hypothetical protein
LLQLKWPVHKRLLFLGKILLSGLALALVFSKLDVSQTLSILKSLNVAWLLLAILLFNLSKILSAFRLNRLFAAIGLNLLEVQNLRLYYIGMFYNLFLPGGIGGDAYKIVMLKKHKQSTVKKTTLAVFLDRLSGMLAIVFLIGVIIVGVLQLEIPEMYAAVIYLLLLALYPLFYLGLNYLLKEFKPAFISISVLGFGVQFSQILCALCLLQAMDVGNLWPEYIALFLFSSIVTIVPITIGGLGARELAFLWGHRLLNVDISLAISLSLLFFLITAFSSLIGAFLRFEEKGRD